MLERRIGSETFSSYSYSSDHQFNVIIYFFPLLPLFLMLMHPAVANVRNAL